MRNAKFFLCLLATAIVLTILTGMPVLAQEHGAKNFRVVARDMKTGKKVRGEWTDEATAKTQAFNRAFESASSENIWVEKKKSWPKRMVAPVRYVKCKIETISGK